MEELMAIENNKMTQMDDMLSDDGKKKRKPQSDEDRERKRLQRQEKKQLLADEQTRKIRVRQDDENNLDIMVQTQHQHQSHSSSSVRMDHQIGLKDNTSRKRDPVWDHVHLDVIPISAEEPEILKTIVRCNHCNTHLKIPKMFKKVEKVRIHFKKCVGAAGRGDVYPFNIPHSQQRSKSKGGVKHSSSKSSGGKHESSSSSSANAPVTNSQNLFVKNMICWLGACDFSTQAVHQPYFKEALTSLKPDINSSAIINLIANGGVNETSV